MGEFHLTVVDDASLQREVRFGNSIAIFLELAWFRGSPKKRLSKIGTFFLHNIDLCSLHGFRIVGIRVLRF